MTPSDAELLATLEQALDERREAWLPVSGESMGRRFTGVEALLVRRIRSDAVRFGSFLVVRAGPEKWVAHRVIWKRAPGKEWLCITKGDGRMGMDVPFRTEADVVGEVAAIRRGTEEMRLDAAATRMVEVMKGALGLSMALVWEVGHTVRRRRWRPGKVGERF